MSKYRAQGFELEQISEIRQGISDGVDVSMYANKSYFAEQMREIRLGLSHDVPVLFYKDPKFDWMQMAEIRLGIESNVDISLYARVSVPFQKMRVIRQSMHDGLFLTQEISRSMMQEYLNRYIRHFCRDLISRIIYCMDMARERLSRFELLLRKASRLQNILAVK